MTQMWSISDFQCFTISWPLGAEAAHQYRWLVMLLIHSPMMAQSVVLESRHNFSLSLYNMNRVVLFARLAI